MPREILLPEVAVDFEQGAIEQWMKSVGDDVAAGDVLLEVSTDKAVVEVEAEFAGRVGRILVDAGTTDVAVRTPIAVMLLDGEDESALQDWTPTAAVAEVSTEVAQQAPVVQHAVEQAAAPKRKRQRIPVSPVARRMAAKYGVDPSGVTGSGPKGRVVLGDIEALIRQQPAAGQTAVPGAPPTRIPVNNIRKVIAKRLTEAKRDVPHFYLTVDCDIDRLLDTRRQLNEHGSSGRKLSVNDFIVRASACALNAMPDVNCAWDDDAILRFNSVDIAIAVTTPSGLMTPVLRAVDQKSVQQISAEVSEVAERARAGGIKPDELKGGGFTVSNLGMYGVRDFAAIINPPQASILAVGAGEQRAVVRDDEIVVATMATLTLSVDHRAIDGALGAEFLNTIKRYLEAPALLLG